MSDHNLILNYLLIEFYILACDCLIIIPDQSSPGLHLGYRKDALACEVRRSSFLTRKW